MADLRISELPDADLPLVGDELIELVQDGQNKKVIADELGGGGVTLLSQLEDVALSPISEGDTLVFNSDDGVWENQQPQTGGGDATEAFARGSVFYPDGVSIKNGARNIFRLESASGSPTKIRLVFEEGVFAEQPQAFVNPEFAAFDDGENQLDLFTLRCDVINKFFAEVSGYGLPADLSAIVPILSPPPFSFLAVGDPDVTSPLTITAGNASGSIGFDLDQITFPFDEATSLVGDRAGNVNNQVFSPGQTLSLTRLQIVSGTQLHLRIRGGSSTPTSALFTAINFTDRNGVPRTLLRSAATASNPVNRTRQWVWTGLSDYFAEGESYEITFN